MHLDKEISINSKTYQQMKSYCSKDPQFSHCHVTICPNLLNWNSLCTDNNCIGPIWLTTPEYRRMLYYNRSYEGSDNKQIASYFPLLFKISNVLKEFWFFVGSYRPTICYQTTSVVNDLRMFSRWRSFSY